MLSSIDRANLLKRVCSVRVKTGVCMTLFVEYISWHF